ncbi:hypothetical protein ACOTVD_09560 [Campylobacter jejuni]|uniref:hypothetical protein n=1 Tax=Campylobacter jejuni TaxID=197 RepID=UPI00296DEBD4|nr:hypothetical protein [Campylobacter jejuni]KAJ9816183.1 hypothetical protein QR412_06045 [Campylobacter jejuni]HEG0492217.1 hypothetical protein [Campylobacter jejuni]
MTTEDLQNQIEILIEERNRFNELALDDDGIIPSKVWDKEKKQFISKVSDEELVEFIILSELTMFEGSIEEKLAFARFYGEYCKRNYTDMLIDIICNQKNSEMEFVASLVLNLKRFNLTKILNIIFKDKNNFNNILNIAEENI